MLILLLVNVLTSWFMVGLIWFVQVVHYPLFGLVQSTGYQRAHVARTTWVVAPVMFAELAATVGVALASPSGAAVPAYLSLALLASIWVSTAGWQVPAHRRLTAAFDPTSHARLVMSNWYRTAAWTLKGGLSLIMLLPAVG